MAERGSSEAPTGTIQYSAVGYNEHGGNVNVRMWDDEMDIRSDGFVSAQDAVDHAPVLFSQDNRVAQVVINESVKQGPGCGWRSGRWIATVEKGGVVTWGPAANRASAP